MSLLGDHDRARPIDNESPAAVVAVGSDSGSPIDASRADQHGPGDGEVAPSQFKP
jgi:hypothetical protein